MLPPRGILLLKIPFQYISKNFNIISPPTSLWNHIGSIKKYHLFHSLSCSLWFSLRFSLIRYWKTQYFQYFSIYISMHFSFTVSDSFSGCHIYLNKIQIWYKLISYLSFYTHHIQHANEFKSANKQKKSKTTKMAEQPNFGGISFVWINLCWFLCEQRD